MSADLYLTIVHDVIMSRVEENKQLDAAYDLLKAFDNNGFYVEEMKTDLLEADDELVNEAVNLYLDDEEKDVVEDEEDEEDDDN